MLQNGMDKAVYATVMVYIGCGLNNIFLEYLVRADNGSGHLITFSQFLFIAIHGLITTSKFFTRTPHINLQHYVVLVGFFFATSVLNNWAFSFKIAVPLHMIFRAGSLIANMVMGIWILKKKYTTSKFLSVAMITLGIIICTIVSSTSPSICNGCEDNIKAPPSEDTSSSATSTDQDFFWWLIGIFILTSALFLSARMGIYQESLYKTHGKYPDEALFYTHFLSLPFFLIYSPNIMEHFTLFIGSENIRVPGIMMEIPILILLLIGNVLTQYLCINAVYILTTECTSLTVTLIITLRKFLSLLFSILYFNNSFTLLHWLGTSLVFLGTLIFTDVFKLNIFSAGTKKTN